MRLQVQRILGFPLGLDLPIGYQSASALNVNVRSCFPLGKIYQSVTKRKVSSVRDHLACTTTRMH